ncbi:MAG: Ldh family oxidoreductase [Alphaproteobacteria bacterium]|jgi:LDH2 family malate/lactate/ureidoglycolate dehydrogenase|nr:Ldh family oxidoreductase [Alphaproteobacteria bacterium]
MAKYPKTEDERRISYEALRDVVQGIFEVAGMSPDDAWLIADTLAFADLRGIHSHGVLRVPEYVAKVTSEGVDPRGRPRVVADNGAALRIDGGNAMGQVGARFAMAAAIERAQETAVAVAALGHSNHCGAMDYWAMMALEHGMIGLATTNALPTMAPHGGIERIVGMNPLAVALPTAEEPPLVLDTAFGATAHGKIRIYHQKGQNLPEGWALDAKGQPTTDAGAALDGLIQPIGAFKGIGLAVVTGLLATVLSGARYGSALGDLMQGPVAGGDGQFFLALKVAAFRPLGEVTAQVDETCRQIRQSRPAEGGGRPYPPGHLEHEIAERQRREGIPLNEQSIAGIVGTAESLGADAGELAS